MKGYFSIEWMAQSSKPSEPEPIPGVGHPACGTHSESLPGFYCRPRSQGSPQQEDSRSHEAFRVQEQTSHNNPGSSEAEEETSGYESEEGHSLSSSDCPSTSSPASPTGRRPRTAFTVEQINSMETVFKRNAYLGTQDKAELCKKLHLSDKQIRNWFQNRRMKLKRTVQEALVHSCPPNMGSQLMHYHELQAYRPGPYPRYHPPGDGPAAPYLHPHGLPYSTSLPLDPLYQYSGRPGVTLTPTANQLMGPYPPYPQYY